MPVRVRSLLLFLIALPVHAFGASQVWQFIPGLSGGEASSPVITAAPNGEVYCAFNFRPAAGGNFAQAVKLSADGLVLWSVQLTDPAAAGFSPKEIATDGTHVVITGVAAGPGSAKDEMFTVNLRSSNGSLRWFHEENINFLPDTGQRIIINGDSAFLAGAVGHAFTAIRVRLDDGLELWQRTFAADDNTVNIGVDLALNPAREVFVSSTRKVGNDPGHIMLVKISPEGQLISETVANDEAEATGLARLTTGRLAVSGIAVTGSGKRPVVQFFGDSGALDGSVIYLTNTGDAFSDIVPGPNGGFACSVQAGTDATLGRFSDTGALISGEVPGPGTVPVLETDNVLNPIAGVAVNPATGSDRANYFRAVDVDTASISLGGVDVKPNDLAVSALNGQWLLAVNRRVGTVDSVEFRAVNPKPKARTDLFEILEGQTLNLAAPGVLANDTAGNGATAVGVNLPATIVLGADGSLAANPPTGFSGVISFVYKAIRGAVESQVTSQVVVQPILREILLAGEVRGGQQTTGQVVLSGSRLINDLVLTVTENSNFTILLQPQVTIPVGQTEGSFTLSTAVPRTDQTATVSVTFAGQTLTKQIVVRAPRLASITTLTPTIIGPAPGSFRVTLDGPAPSNGIAVNLTDDSSFIATPSALAIPANAVSADYTAITAATTATKSATITATLNGSTVTTSCQIVGLTFSISPNTKIGGQQGTGTLTLTSATGAPIVFDLTDNSTATAFNSPPTVTIGLGSATGTFQILTAAVVNTVTSTITATGQGVAKTATLTVQAAVLDSVSVNPGSVRGGQSFSATLRLTGISVAGGSVVTLSDNSTNVTLPATATISGGSASKLVNGTTTAVASSVMVVITASRNGVTKTTTLVVTP